MRFVVHGGGYTGFSGALAAAKAGHEVLIYEPNPARVRAIRAHEEPVTGLAAWMGDALFYHPIAWSRLEVTDVFADVERVPVHVFAVPTERDGEPEFTLINAAIDRVVAARHGRPLVLAVESTVHPSFAAQLRQRIANDRAQSYTLIIAPRRDWFVGPGQTVETCERVIGVDDDDDRRIAAQLYGPISARIHWTTTETAEITKQLENAQMYAGLTFLMGFALSYPDVDVREVLRLAGTHWRLPAWHLPLGIAGYCVPLGMKYLNGGRAFSYAQTALETEAQWRLALASRLATQKHVAILGVSDKVHQRIQHLSPALTLYHWLSANSTGRVVVHDAQFAPSDVGVDPSDWLTRPEDLQHADAVVVNTGYPTYRPWLRYMLNAEFVLDAPGLFDDQRGLFKPGAYRRIAEAGWLR